MAIQPIDFQITCCTLSSRFAHYGSCFVFNFVDKTSGRHFTLPNRKHTFSTENKLSFEHL